MKKLKLKKFELFFSYKNTIKLLYVLVCTNDSL
jgi:hypothetical protein